MAMTQWEVFGYVSLALIFLPLVQLAWSDL
jgi:hypothetical protein